MASSVSIVENGLSSSAPVSSASSPNNKNTSNTNTNSTAHRHSHSSATPSSPLARVNSMTPSSSSLFEHIARMPRINPYFNRKVSGSNVLPGNNKNGVYDKKGGGMLPPVTAIVSMEIINGCNGSSSHEKGDLSGKYGKRSPLAKLSLPPCTTNEDPIMHSSGSEKNCSINGNAMHPHNNFHHEDHYDDEDVMVNRTAPRVTVPTPQSRGKPLHAIVCSSESSSPSSPPPVLSSMESYSSKGGSYLRVGVSAAEEGAAEGRGLECNKMPSFSCSGTVGAATVPPLTRNTQKQGQNDKLLSSTISGTDSNNNNPKCIGAYPKRRSNDQWEDFLQTSFTSSNISASVNLGSISTASASLTDSVMNAGGAGGGPRSRTASGSTGTRLKVSRNNKGELVDANSSASSSRAATDEPRPLSRHSSSLTVEQLAALRRTPSFRSRQHSPPPMMLSLGSSGFPSPSGTNTVQVLRRRRRDPGSAPLDDEEGDIFSRDGGKGGGDVQRNNVEFPATPHTGATTMDAVIISRETLLTDADAPANIVKTQNEEGQKGSNTLKSNQLEKTPTHAGGDGLYSECDVTYSADGYSTSLALPPGATPVSTVAATRSSSLRDELPPEVVLSTVSEASIATSDSTPRTLLATHNAAPTQPGTSTEAEVDKELGGSGGEVIALVPSPPTSRRTSARSKRKQVGVFCLDEDDDPFDVTAGNNHDAHNNTTSKPAEGEAIGVGSATASPASAVGQEAAPAPFISIKADIPFNTDSTQARASDSSEDDEEESDALLDGFRPEGFAARRGARSKNSIVFFLTSEESPTATAEEMNMDDEKKKDNLNEHLPRPPLVKTTGYLGDPFFPSPPMPTKPSSSLATNSWRSLFEGHCSRPTEDTTTTTSTYTTPKQQQQTSMPLPEHPLPQLQAVSILLGSSSKYAADPAKMQRPEENTFGRRRRNRYSRQCTTEEDDDDEEEEGNDDEGPDSRECDTGDDYEWYWEEIEEEGDNGENDEEQEEEEDS